MLFFYDQITGATGTGELDASGDYVSLKDFPAGQFGHWTHIVSGGGELFFYSRETHTAGTGRLAADGDYVNLKDFPAGQFGYWSNIVVTQEGTP